MKLVIERGGGFTIVEDAGAITEIDVRNDAVVLTIEVGGDKWTTELPVSSHAEACRVSAAIAVRCGELVKSLSQGPDEAEARTELAAIIGGTTEVGEVASEWVDGEPPRDGRWYVVAWGPFPNGAAWGAQWDAVAGTWRRHDGERVRGPGRHLPTPIPNR